MGRRRLGAYLSPQPWPIAATIELVGNRLLLPAGAAPGVKGAWVEVDAVVQSRTVGLVIALHNPTLVGEFVVDIGLGGLGAEAAIIENIRYEQVTAVGLGIMVYRFGIIIPAGVRVAARTSSPGAPGTFIRITVWEEQET